jgi:hypothetical protein
MGEGVSSLVPEFESATDPTMSSKGKPFQFIFADGSDEAEKAVKVRVGMGCAEVTLGDADSGAFGPCWGASRTNAECGGCTDKAYSGNVVIVNDVEEYNVLDPESNYVTRTLQNDLEGDICGVYIKFKSVWEYPVTPSPPGLPRPPPPPSPSPPVELPHFISALTCERDVFQDPTTCSRYGHHGCRYLSGKGCVHKTRACEEGQFWATDSDGNDIGCWCDGIREIYRDGKCENVPCPNDGLKYFVLGFGSDLGDEGDCYTCDGKYDDDGNRLITDVGGKRCISRTRNPAPQVVDKWQACVDGLGNGNQGMPVEEANLACQKDHNAYEKALAASQPDQRAIDNIPTGECTGEGKHWFTDPVDGSVKCGCRLGSYAVGTAPYYTRWAPTGDCKIADCTTKQKIGGPERLCVDAGCGPCEIYSEQKGCHESSCPINSKPSGSYILDRTEGIVGTCCKCDAGTFFGNDPSFGWVCLLCEEFGEGRDRAGVLDGSCSSEQLTGKPKKEEEDDCDEWYCSGNSNKEKLGKKLRNLIHDEEEEEEKPNPPPPPFPGSELLPNCETKWDCDWTKNEICNYRTFRCDKAPNPWPPAPPPRPTSVTTSSETP